MEFKKLSEVSIIEDTTENTNVLVEENGEIKRVSGKNLKAGSNIRTAIIKSSDYDSLLQGMQTAATDAPAVTYECINMTFDEALEILMSGEILQAIGLIATEGCTQLHLDVLFYSGFDSDISDMILLLSNTVSLQLEWTRDGFAGGI